MPPSNDMRPAGVTLATASLDRVTTQARPGQPAVQDVSFAMARGEILALMGVGAGSGTGTVLQLFAGFARARGGQVLVGGRMMDETPPHRRGIGVVMRRISLFPHLDVGGHARFAPGVSAAQADAILQRLDLQAFARRRWQDLSPDLQFRVALARALAPGPRLLLLEDPTGALPHLQVGPIKALLRALAAETGVAILFNTDDITACYGLADRIGVMQSGVLRQIGTPQDLYDNPLSLPVAQALGPLNRMAGTVVDLDDDIAAIRLAGGALVEARFVDDLKPGEACVVALRPERIAVATGNLAELGDGAVPVHLVETVFAGDQQRLRFSMDRSRGQAPEIFVTRPVGAILPRTADMCLAWQPHHARAFRTEAA